MAGTMKYEQTNKRLSVFKQDAYVDNGWKTVTMKFAKKCDVCQRFISVGQKSMWHINSGKNIHIVEECKL